MCGRRRRRRCGPRVTPSGRGTGRAPADGRRRAAEWVAYAAVVATTDGEAGRSEVPASAGPAPQCRRRRGGPCCRSWPVSAAAGDPAQGRPTAPQRRPAGWGGDSGSSSDRMDRLAHLVRSLGGGYTLQRYVRVLCFSALKTPIQRRPDAVFIPYLSTGPEVLKRGVEVFRRRVYARPTPLGHDRGGGGASGARWLSSHHGTSGPCSWQPSPTAASCWTASASPISTRTSLRRHTHRWRPL